MPLVKEKVLDKNSSSLSAETFLFRATAACRPLWRLHGVRLCSCVWENQRSNL